MANRERLTKSIIEHYRHKGIEYLSDVDVPQLKVRYLKTKTQFVVRWTSETAGKLRQEPLAEVHEISVAEARKRALHIMVHDKPREAETLGDVFQIWKKHYAKAGTQNTADFERGYKLHIEAHIGKTKLAKLKYADIHDWYSAKLKEHPPTPTGNRRKTPYSPNSVKRFLNRISRLCTIARQRELMSHNPVEAVEIVTPRTRKDVFSKDDMIALGENLDRVKKLHPVGVALLRFLMLYPCRAKEAREMEWSDLDLDQGLWTIPAERYKTDTDKVFPLGPLQIDHLRSLPDWSETYVFRRPSTLGLGSSRLTAPGEDAPVTKNHQIAVWNKVRPKKLGAHTLRKTIATTMLNGDVPLEVVSKLLGHSTTQVTQQAYASLAPQTARKHLDMWQNFLEDEPEPEDDIVGEVLQRNAELKAHEQNKAVDEEILRALG
mgnify:CR=1 FL=1